MYYPHKSLCTGTELRLSICAKDVITIERDLRGMLVAVNIDYSCSMILTHEAVMIIIMG